MTLSTVSKEPSASLGSSAACCLLCRERNIREIYTMYSVTFPTLSERFFKGTSWPPVELVSELVDHDHVFCLLYKVNKGYQNTARARAQAKAGGAAWQPCLQLVLLQAPVRPKPPKLPNRVPTSSNMYP